METEKEKATCEAEHQLKASEYTTIQERLAYLLSDIPRTIKRAGYQLCHCFASSLLFFPFCNVGSGLCCVAIQLLQNASATVPRRLFLGISLIWSRYKLVG